MKRSKLILTITSCIAALVLVLSAVGCSESETDESTIVVGASPTPHAQILEVAGEVLAEQGYTLEIREFTDYVLPNTALEAQELDANYFQHEPYLKNFNEENGTHLTNAGYIHYEPLGIYSKKLTSLDALGEGAKIAVPSDATNEARALQFLAEKGIITLKDGVGLLATKADIVSNPLNVEIVELEAANIPNALPDVDLGLINGNYVLNAGIAGTALAVEDASSEAALLYRNVVACRDDNKDSEKIQALIAALQSDEVRTFINSTYPDVVVPSF